MVIRTDCLKRPIIASVAVFGLAVIGLLVPEPAAAQSDAARQACMGDAQRFCSQFMSDQSQMNACMNRNSKRLSPACRAAMGGGKKAKKKRG